MDLMTLAVLIIAIAVAVAVAALVPSLIQLKRTLKSAERLLDDTDVSVKTLVDEEVKPLMRSINNTVSELEGVARGARSGVEKIEETIDAFRGIGETVRGVNYVIDQKIKGSLIDVAAYIFGVKAGLGTFIDSIKALKKKEVA